MASACCWRWLGALAIVLAVTGGAEGRGVPVAQQPLPHVPGYIPVYIQSGDSPPDVQRLYEAHAAHRTLPQQQAAQATRRVAQAVPPPPADKVPDGAPVGGEVRDAAAAPASSSNGPRQRPQAPPQAVQQADGAPPPQGPPLRSRVPVQKDATGSRITKKGAAGPVPSGTSPAAAAPSRPKTVPKPPAKKRTGTRVQYQQQQKAAQTRKRQQQQRSAKQQQQQQQQR